MIYGPATCRLSNSRLRVGLGLIPAAVWQGGEREAVAFQSRENQWEQWPRHSAAPRRPGPFGTLAETTHKLLMKVACVGSALQLEDRKRRIGELGSFVSRGMHPAAPPQHRSGHGAQDRIRNLLEKRHDEMLDMLVQSFLDFSPGQTEGLAVRATARECRADKRVTQYCGIS
jgi:hypothetical protein